MTQDRDISQRLARKEISLSRSNMVYKAKQPLKDKSLAESVKALSEKYPRFGYRRIAVMPGWQMNEFTAKAVIEWLTVNQIGPAFIKPGSPWQNAYVESFNGKFRDECLSREWF